MTNNFYLSIMLHKCTFWVLYLLHRMKITKKTTILVVILFVLIFLIVRVTGNQESNLVTATDNMLRTVTLLDISTQNTSNEIILTAHTASSNAVQIKSETSGRITRVLKRIGDSVSVGDIIFTIDNTSLRIALNQAETNLAIARENLRDLTDNNLNSEDSIIANIDRETSIAIENAYRNLLNNDLRVYSDDPTEVNETPPQITGTYNGPQGTYILKTYASGQPSGASILLSGLESGVVPASTTLPAPLGNNGLFIQFEPSNNIANKTWIIEIPNTRSETYSAALSVYENAKASKNTIIATSEVKDSDIKRAELAVKTQELALASAQDNFNRTQIRSFVDGEITESNVKVGDYVTNSQNIATIENLSSIELVMFTSPIIASQIDVGDTVTYNNETGSITYVAQNLGQGKKSEIRAQFSDTESLKAGDTIDVVINTKSNSRTKEGKSIVPVKALQIIGSQEYVYTVTPENQAKSILVETGALFGTDILISDGLTDVDFIISDARGIKEGDQVSF